jgi:hypothetical protein
MAREIGAELIDIDKVSFKVDHRRSKYIPPVLSIERISSPKRSFWPLRLSEESEEYFYLTFIHNQILVNGKGVRFVNELQGRDKVSAAIFSNCETVSNVIFQFFSLM